MTKKIILAVLVVALLIAAFVMVRFLGKDLGSAEEQPTAESEMQQTEETTLPGLEDSIFDDEWDEETESSEEETTEATVAEEESAEATDPTTETEVTTSTDPTTEAEATTPTTPATGNDSTTPTNPGTTEETTQPAQPDSGAEETTTPTKPTPQKMAYEVYESMSAAQQRDYMMSFESIEKFFDWYNKVKAEYDKAHPDIEIEGGKVEIGQKG